MEVSVYIDDAYDRWEPSGEVEQEFHDSHDSYTLKIYCDITTVGETLVKDAVKNGSGCCLRDYEGTSNGGMDTSSSRNGGYCVLINGNADGILSYYATDEQWVQNIDAASIVKGSILTDGTSTGFGSFYLDLVNTDKEKFNYFTAIKAQPVSATGDTNPAGFPGTRFTAEDKVIGYIYNGEAGDDTWKMEKEDVLSSNAAGLSMAFAAAGSFLAFSMF